MASLLCPQKHGGAVSAAYLQCLKSDIRPCLLKLISLIQDRKYFNSGSPFVFEILAQMGCYVPAEFASFRLSDHIFSRVGSDDDIDTNTSSFTMEMKEVYFLFYCSPLSQRKYIKFLTTPYIHHFLHFFFFLLKSCVNAINFQHFFAACSLFFSLFLFCAVLILAESSLQALSNMRLKITAISYLCRL